MTTLEKLEKRIQRLEDERAIEKLMCEYWNCMDQKNWTRFAELFTDDFVFYVRDTEEAIRGGSWFVEETQQEFPDGVVSSHHGHQHYIDITSDTTANAVWALQDDLYNANTGSEYVGRAYYNNQFAKVDGDWKCKVMDFKYIRGEAVMKGHTSQCANAYKSFYL